MTDAYIALGSNLGDRRATLERAVREIDGLESTRVVVRSTLIETDPVGPVAQGRYLNGVVHVQTKLTPRALLESLLAIESELGRDRTGDLRWGPRTADLDLLIFGDLQIDDPGLHVPHPRLAERRFVLEPLCEIAPGLVVPGLGKSVRELFNALTQAEGAECS